jgi:cytochrome c peroxidase
MPTPRFLRTGPIKCPYFHDGSAKTLMDVVNHYDQQFKLDLSEAEKSDLVEYLKSLY